MEEILNKAKEEEEVYEWLKASEYYRKAVTLVPESDFVQKGETCESLGHAVYKGAFQAQNRDEFKERIQQAVQEYDEAKRFHEGKSETGTPRALRCEAMIALSGCWLASKVPEKKRLLSESWRLAKEALDLLRKQEMRWSMEKHTTYFHRVPTSSLLMSGTLTFARR